jgi:hypothetical protein
MLNAFELHYFCQCIWLVPEQICPYIVISHYNRSLYAQIYKKTHYSTKQLQSKTTNFSLSCHAIQIDKVGHSIIECVC